MTRSIPDWWARDNGWDFWARYDAGEWEPLTRSWIEEYTPAKTFVDVGAWIGPTSLWAAPIAKRVVAVDADPVAREHFMVNLAGHDNVELVSCAITDHNGTALLVPHLEGFGSAMSMIDAPGELAWDLDGSIPVECQTLPAFFDEHDLDDVGLVKMDIEGGEFAILAEVCPFLAEKGIPFVLSLHPWGGPIEEEWFDCFSSVEGDLWAYTTAADHDQRPLLCLP